MHVDAQLDAVLNLLYESALQPERLHEALHALTRALDGETFHFAAWERATGKPVQSLSAGIAVNIGPDWAAHYARIDPRLNLMLAKPDLPLIACHEHFDSAFVRRNEFYQDYLIPQTGLRYLLGSGDLSPGSAHTTVLGFQRSVGTQPFSTDQVRAFGQVLPHLKRSLQLMRQCQQNPAPDATPAPTPARHFSEALLDSTHFGGLRLSGSARLEWSNRLGETILTSERGLRLKDGVVLPVQRAQESSFLAALQETCRTSRVTNLNLGTRQQALCVSLIPARTEPDDHAPLRSAFALLVDGAHLRIAAASQLMDWFGLTRAEARLVRGLAHGETLDEYAAHEGIKTSTAKTHLASALEKTGKTSQRDLVSWVVRLPAVRQRD